MVRAKRLPRETSKKMFSRSASRTHYKNVQDRPMRGGIRL
jgi:hypothetical protein